MTLEGDQIPVSAMPYDGSLPLSTTKLEKRRIAPQVPRWVKENCIQCNQCVMACPHAVIRAKQVEPAALEEAPAAFETLPSKSLNERNLAYRIQVYLEDCTGCGVCIETCPPKLKALEFTTLEQGDTEAEIENTTFFEALPDDVLDGINTETVKGIQLKRPLFEFSGACAGVRRNALHQIINTALWRTFTHRQCHGLFFDIWRYVSDGALSRYR